MPHVRELYDELKDEGFDIVAVSLDQDLDAVRDFLQEKKTPWVNLIGEETQQLAERYGVRAIPTMMLVDAEGQVVAVAHKVSELAPQARKLLEKE
jgi:peroxiredoxin